MPEFWLLILTLPFPLLAYRAGRVYGRILQLPEHVEDGLPPLSIIVPARNEADNLRLLLPSLNRLDYPGQLEIIVVDDGSVDQTAAVAEGLGARCVPAGRLPEGWLGKAHACHQGARQAGGDWLLFTDADTQHDPKGLSRAMQLCRQMDLDGLSLLLDQASVGLLDSLALMAAFAGMFAALDPQFPLLNGQYILIRRRAYFESGGFAAVRSEPLEDLALGDRLFRHGLRVPLANGEQVAQVHMYLDFAQMWQGLTRIGAGSLRWFGIRAWISVGFVASGVTPLVGVVLFVQGDVAFWAVGLSWLLVSAGFLPWAIRFASGWQALLAPLGFLLVQLAACWGLLCRVLGRGISWKGRLVRNL